MKELPRQEPMWRYGKPYVTKKFVEKWGNKIVQTFRFNSRMQAEIFVRKLLKEAGVEIINGD